MGEAYQMDYGTISRIARYVLLMAKSIEPRSFGSWMNHRSGELGSC